MQTIREDVQAFVRLTEKLLSPILLGKAFNEDERGLVAMCAQSLVEKYPTMEVSTEKTRSMPEVMRSEKQSILRQSRRVMIESRAVIEKSSREIQDTRTDIGQMKERIK